MNILFLSELFYPHGSGAELATYLWAKLLSKEGFHVRVVTNRFPTESSYTVGNLTVIRLPIFKATAHVKYSVLKRPDVLFSGIMRKLMVWADLVYVPRFWYSAIPLAKAYGKPVIIHLHDYIAVCSLASRYDLSENKVCENAFCHPSCLLRHEMLHGRNISEALASSFLNIAVWGNVRRLVEFSDAVVCVSDAQRDIVVKRMPSLALKCHTIHNPLPETTPRKVEGEDIGYFGGPDPLKGFPVLYSALKRTRSRATVRMTGFAQKNEQVGRSKLVFYERLREEEFRRVYTHVKAVVVPSIWPDPLPYVVSEGLLNRRLIIASRIGGIPELARNCPGVFLFAPGDSHRLAELIDYINDLDNHTTAKLAQTDRKTFLTEYRNEDRLQEFREIAVNMLSAHE